MARFGRGLVFFSPFFVSLFFVVLAGKAGGVLVFVSGEDAEQVAVGLGAQDLGAAAIAVEKARGEDAVGFGFQLVERVQGKAVSAVEAAQDFKDLGFALPVGTRTPGFGLLGLRLRGWFGAYNFVNSHGLPDLLSGELRLGRVRCSSTGRCPTLDCPQAQSLRGSAIGHWLLAVSFWRFGCGYFFLIFRFLRGTGDFVCAFCFSRSLE
jgi:hypothetical protein